MKTMHLRGFMLVFHRLQVTSNNYQKYDVLSKYINYVNHMSEEAGLTSYQMIQILIKDSHQK